MLPDQARRRYLKNGEPELPGLEQVTKRFFARFKVEYDRFVPLVKGFARPADCEWYAFLTLNRLIFLYFIQKKGCLDATRGDLLDGDRDYLANRLRLVQVQKGQDWFHWFYRSFLLRLFHKGSDSHQSSEELESLLGRVPFLNGGLLASHELEREYPGISVPDEAFARIFAFFDEFDWSLDPGSSQGENKVNPDIIGSLFEKYVDHKDKGKKEIGAYYTGEDITGYICQHALVPFLFDRVRLRCPVAFEKAGPIWSLLARYPDRYIHSALRKGCALPLPPEIEAGIVPPCLSGDGWNNLAAEEYALPEETWREVMLRRQRYASLKARLSSGEICSVDDLTTCNLDILRFVLDVILACDGVELLVALYENLEAVTILDPTCGSGAFLFAAQTILQPLYEACLVRMQAIVEQEECWKRVTPSLQCVCGILRRAARYPNWQSFINTSIATGSLYGVDIMPEAVETCRLRLFLPLIARIERVVDIEPLTGLDFHIHAGNSLVGFTTFQQVRASLERNPRFGQTFDQLEQQAQKSAESLARFRLFQREQGEVSEELARMKCQSGRGFARLRHLLHRYLAAEYGVDSHHIPDQRLRVQCFHQWQQNFQPFHWCIDFYEVINRGGFDIIIGNPPYVAYNKVKATYQLRGYQTQACGNLYAYVLERALSLLRPGGRCGVIVPVSAIASEHYQALTRLLLQRQVWISSYSNRPGRLFAGVEQRLAILLVHEAVPATLFTSPYRHWYEREREHLFATLAYTRATVWSRTGMPLKSGSEQAERIFARMSRGHLFALKTAQYLQMGYGNEDDPALPLPSMEGDWAPGTPPNWRGGWTPDCRQAGAVIWIHNGPTYWVRALPFAPRMDRTGQCSGHYLRVPVNSQDEAFVLAAVFSSSTFYLFYKMVSNCRDLGQKELRCFPLGELQPVLRQRLLYLGKRLATRLRETAGTCRRRYPGGLIEYEEYYPARAKAVIDEIDRVLAEHYGFTAEELEFLLNYEIKYRMGRA